MTNLRVIDLSDLVEDVADAISLSQLSDKSVLLVNLQYRSVSNHQTTRILAGSHQTASYLSR